MTDYASRLNQFNQALIMPMSMPRILETLSQQTTTQYPKHLPLHQQSVAVLVTLVQD